MLRRVLRRAGRQVSRQPPPPPAGGAAEQPRPRPRLRGPVGVASPLSVCRSDVSRLEEELRSLVAALLDDFLEPERNKLTRRHL